ncbi:protein-glutamate methylesterase [Salmonella enterica subsp. enterica]|uniref:Protein-glutamate methylesterase n=1 Tax=Salmonella enterica I TaxID=59201 RepID=A0A379WT35_SALET|nr:protein-glutamate methylesterase [Salmonella enterica subsp. enterica]
MCCFIRWRNTRGRNAVGVILTGMGQRWRRWNVSDVPGWRLDHCAKRKQVGVVFGMPREAINMGGVSEVVDLSQVSQQMLAKISAGQAIRI